MPALVGRPTVHQLGTWRESTYFVFSLLWKTRVPIPDTLFVDDARRVDGWLFVAKRGDVLRHKSAKTSAERFVEHCERRASGADEFVAVRRDADNQLLDAETARDAAAMVDLLAGEPQEDRGDRFCLLEYVPPTSDTRFVVRFQRESYVPEAAFSTSVASRRHSVFYGTAWDDGTSAINRRLTAGLRAQLQELVEGAVRQLEAAHNVVVVDLYAEAVEHAVKGALMLTGVRRVRCVLSEHSSQQVLRLAALPSEQQRAFATPAPPESPADVDFSSGDEEAHRGRSRTRRPRSAARLRPLSPAAGRPQSAGSSRSPVRRLLRPRSASPSRSPGPAGRNRSASPARSERSEDSDRERERDFRPPSAHPKEIPAARPRPTSAGLAYRTTAWGDEVEAATWSQEHVDYNRPRAQPFHNGSELEVALQRARASARSPTHVPGPAHLSFTHHYLEDVNETATLEEPNAVEVRALQEIASLNDKYERIMAQLGEMERQHEVDIGNISQVDAENQRLNRHVGELRNRFERQSVALTQQRKELTTQLKEAEEEGDATLKQLEVERWNLHLAQEKLTEVRGQAQIAERARDDLKRTVASAQDPEMVKVRDEAERLATAVERSAAEGQRMSADLASLEKELEVAKKELMLELTFRAHTYKLLADPAQPGVDHPGKAGGRYPRPRAANVQRAVIGLMDGQYRSVCRRGAIFKPPAEARALRGLLSSAFITSYPMIEREEDSAAEGSDSSSSDDSDSDDDVDDYVVSRGAAGAGAGAGAGGAAVAEEKEDSDADSIPDGYD